MRTLFHCAILLATFAIVSRASAVGYWNIPGNVCQCSGYGWGAGYHAKLVLGPITHHDFLAHNEVRLPFAPQPPYVYYDHCGCDHDYGQQSLIAPGAVPVEAPVEPSAIETLPESAAPEEIYLPPALEMSPDESAPERAAPENTPEAAPPTLPTSWRPLFDPPVER
jgi:hypothetical protein